MDERKEDLKTSLDFHYKEMTRISNFVLSSITGIFDDFKLLLAVGGMLAWKPLHDALKLGSPEDTQLLFWGFLAILLFLSLVGILNMLRQLIIKSQLEEIQNFELKIRSLLGCPDSPTFRSAENWKIKATPRQISVSIIFQIHFYIIALIPLFILNSGRAHYLIFALTTIALNIVTSIIVYSQGHSKD